VFNLAHSVTRSILLDAPPQEVWEALTDGGLLSEWLAPEVELEPHEGGELVCRFADGEERRGEVAVVEEAERLAFHWRRQEGGESWVEWTLDAVADGTRLTVIESATPAGPMLVGPAAAWAPRLTVLRLVLGRLVLA
jgi:uncharacterized protein YndB with AHSA1/START domain